MFDPVADEHHMAIEKDLLDQILAGRDPQNLFVKDDLVDELKKSLSERLLKAQLDAHVICDAGRMAGNHCNGASTKTMLTGMRHDQAKRRRSATLIASIATTMTTTAIVTLAALSYWNDLT